MLLPWFEWCEATFIGQAVRDSLWLFPVIQSVHLLALALIGGSVLIVDLRLLGLGLTHHPVADLSSAIRPWFRGSFATMLVSGMMLFSSEALRCYYSPPFWWKMYFLLAASLFAATVHRYATSPSPSGIPPIAARATGIVSLALWTGVGISGRWIAFY